MADARQTFLDAIQDAEAWSEFINGDDGQSVTTRLDKTYPTLEGAIRQIMARGAVEANVFNTKADMIAGGVPVGEYALVINDSVVGNNGYYKKTASAFDYLNFNAGFMIDDALSNVIVAEYPKNMYNPSTKVMGYYLNISGDVARNSAWSISDYIPVQAGQAYTVSALERRIGAAFFRDKSGTAIEGSYFVDGTATAPSDAKYLVVNIDSPNDTGNRVQVEKGSKATEYAPFESPVYKIKGSAASDLVTKSELNDRLSDITSSSDAALLVVNEDRTASIITSNNLDLKIDLAIIQDDVDGRFSTAFNFRGDFVDDVNVKLASDDVPPLRVFGQSVGGNHGYAKVVAGISTGHGMSQSDIGSIWSDGDSEWVLVEIINAKSVSFVSRANKTSMSVNSLTHVSGASNSSPFDVTIRSVKQWYPSFKSQAVTAYVDGSKIEAGKKATYNYKHSATFVESYEVMSKDDMLQYVVDNRKTVDPTAIDGSVLVNNTYSFDVDGGCTIYTSITALKESVFGDYMATQAYRLADDGRQYYVPKSKPFTQDDQGFNFSAVQPMPDALQNSVIFDASKQEENANPVDRLIQIDSDGIGFATGFLPLYDAEPDRRKVVASRCYLEIRGSSLKVYPRLVDGISSPLSVGDTYGGIAYRKYFKQQNGRTANYVVRSTAADYLYLDWHTAMTDKIELPDDLIGRQFKVHEKSSNVTVVSKFATSNLVVTIDDSKGYGYLVLQFDK